MGAGGSAQEIRAHSGPYQTRRVPDRNSHIVPRHKLPHQVLEGFTSYMKTEIEKSQEKQKRNRQASLKQAPKSTNPPAHPQSTNIISSSTANNSIPVPISSNHPLPESNDKKPDSAHQNHAIEESKNPHMKSDGGENDIKEINHTHESKVKDSDRTSFKVETEEREIEVYKNPESPRPAPPVFDENLEAEAIYNNLERKAKEKEAVELAQKVAHENKLKIEHELGEKRNELNQLEDKYENIAAKYMNKK